MEQTVIVSFARTPFGKFGGGLSALPAVELGGIAIQNAVERAKIDPGQVDYVYMGHVLQGGCGQVPARQAARRAGLPWETPAVTVNKVCSSGMTAIALADAKIRLGEASVVVAGGMESMSNAPYLLRQNRWGARMGNGTTEDLMLGDGLWCPFYDRHMAVHGAEVSAEYGVSREAQDEWACNSQMKAADAVKSGHLDAELVPVEVEQKKSPVVIARDEAPRPDTTVEGLAKLPPVFTRDGTVTAGNAPGVNDGAAALALMAKSKAKALGLDILATVAGHAEVSQEAKYIATVPGLSAKKLLQDHSLKMDEIKVFEVNEAFAAVVLVSGQIAGWDNAKVNVDGGAIAFGHPIGASGARIVMHAVSALRQLGGGYGVACICSGAAQGDAILLKVE